MPKPLSRFIRGLLVGGEGMTRQILPARGRDCRAWRRLDGEDRRTEEPAGRFGDLADIFQAFGRAMGVVVADAGPEIGRQVDLVPEDAGGHLDVEAAIPLQQLLDLILGAGGGTGDQIEPGGIDLARP